MPEPLACPAPAVNWDDATLVPTLVERCGFAESLPEFGSESAFLGDMLQVETSSTNYEVYRWAVWAGGRSVLHASRGWIDGMQGCPQTS